MKILRYAAMATVGLALLSGCGIVPGTGTPQGTNGPPPAATSTSNFGVANADMSVMAQATAAVGAIANGENVGGSLTGILRSVEVGQEIMTVRFAIQWDNNDAKDTDAADPYHLGLSLSGLTVVDRDNLVAYRVFCTKGSYTSGAGSLQDCVFSQLISPDTEYHTFYFPNHGLVEGYALLPAPKGHPEKVDVSMGSPFPAFTNATVTYV